MRALEYFPWCQQQLLAGRISCHFFDGAAAGGGSSRPGNLSPFRRQVEFDDPAIRGGRAARWRIGLNTTRAERDWPDALVKRLQLVAQIFANALARKRADQTLRESEARLTLATASAEAGLWELDYATQVFLDYREELVCSSGIRRTRSSAWTVSKRRFIPTIGVSFRKASNAPSRRMNP